MPLGVFRVQAKDGGGGKLELRIDASVAELRIRQPTHAARGLAAFRLLTGRQCVMYETPGDAQCFAS